MSGRDYTSQAGRLTRIAILSGACFFTGLTRLCFELGMWYFVAKYIRIPSTIYWGFAIFAVLTNLINNWLTRETKLLDPHALTEA